MICPFTKQECTPDCALFFQNPYNDKTSCSFHSIAFASVVISEELKEISSSL